MTRNTGHIVRIIGLMTEMLGIWGVYGSNRVLSQPLFTLTDGTVITRSWAAVGVGFVLWLTGTILVYTTRPKRKRRPDSDEELC